MQVEPIDPQREAEAAFWRRTIAERVEALRRAGKCGNGSSRPADRQSFMTCAEMQRPFDPAGVEDDGEAWRLTIAHRIEAHLLAIRCGPTGGCRIPSCRRSKRCPRRVLLAMAEPGELT